MLNNDEVNVSLGGGKSKTIDKAVLQLGRRGIHGVRASANKGKEILGQAVIPGCLEAWSLSSVIRSIFNI